MAKGINSFAFISFLTFLEIFLYNRIFTSHSSKIYYSEYYTDERIKNFPKTAKQQNNDKPSSINRN